MLINYNYELLTFCKNKSGLRTLGALELILDCDGPQCPKTLISIIIQTYSYTHLNTILLLY